MLVVTVRRKKITTSSSILSSACVCCALSLLICICRFKAVSKMNAHSALYLSFLSLACSTLAVLLLQGSSLAAGSRLNPLFLLVGVHCSTCETQVFCKFLRGVF